MRPATFVLFGLSLTSFLPLSAQTPAGWQTMKEKSGTCQISVPANWKINAQLPSFAQAPDNSDANVLAEPTPMKTMSEAVQKVIGVDKMFENTMQRVFYSTKPTKGLVGYHLKVPAKSGTCVGMITIKEGHSEEEVKQIAKSLVGK